MTTPKMEQRINSSPFASRHFLLLLCSILSRYQVKLCCSFSNVALQGVNRYGGCTSSTTASCWGADTAITCSRQNGGRRFVTISSTSPRCYTPLSALSMVPPSLPFVIVHVVAGATGTPVVVAATRNENGWYRKISLPSFTPPDSIFAPVWTTLYAMMGVAVGRIFHFSPSRTRTLALASWTAHIVMNLSWAPIFFGLKSFRLGLIVNYALWTSLVVMVLPTFHRVDPLSAYLLLPYLGWLSFATILNQVICKMNPTTNGYNNAKFQSQLTKLQQQAAEYAGE